MNVCSLVVVVVAGLVVAFSAAYLFLRESGAPGLAPGTVTYARA